MPSFRGHRQERRRQARRGISGRLRRDSPGEPGTRLKEGEGNKLDIYIRAERSGDFEQIDALLGRAFTDDVFSQGYEETLLRELRGEGGLPEELSIVAERRGEIIGYVMLVPAAMAETGETKPPLFMAPVAVAPEYQGRAVGSRLVEHALGRARDLGYGSVFVLGHPAYYPRFGFKTASLWGITTPLDVPDESFMALELVEGSLAGYSGTLDLPKAFKGL
jgi:predicted N-acetyltransferase YhbS